MILIRLFQKKSVIQLVKWIEKNNGPHKPETEPKTEIIRFSLRFFFLVIAITLQ